MSCGVAFVVGYFGFGFYLSLSIERVAHSNLNLRFFFLNVMNLINGVVQTIGLNKCCYLGLFCYCGCYLS